MVNTIDQQLALVRTYYLSGDGGQHPHIIESVVAAIDFAYTSAVAECPAGDVTLGSLRRTLTAAADSASANAAIYDALVCTGSGGEVLPLEYLAAWAAQTAEELRAVFRALETECAADPPAVGRRGCVCTGRPRCVATVSVTIEPWGIRARYPIRTPQSIMR